MTAIFSPFAVAADPWFVRSRSYVTDIQVTDDGTEQRRMLRLIPTERVSYTARTIDSRMTGWHQALVYGGQDEDWVIPYWPHGWYLGAAAVAGSNVVLSVDTTNRDFTVGGQLVLWRDERTTEACTITAKSGTTVTVSTLASNWPAGTFVMPGLTGSFSTGTDFRRLAAMMGETRVTFDLTLGSDPAVSTPTSPAVFTTVPFIRDLEIGDDTAYQVDRIENSTYTYADYARRPDPQQATPMKLWLSSRANIASVIAWFDGLKGSLAAFYLPSYQQDLTVVSGLGTSSLVISNIGYTARLFPLTNRKQLAFVTPSGAVTQRTVSASVNNGNGTETLTLSGAAPSTTSLVSWLRRVRLADDTLAISWMHSERATCALRVVEVPA